MDEFVVQPHQLLCFQCHHSVGFTNPGWDSNAQKLASFTDIRDLQRQLKARGVELQQQADESTTGPASFVAVDPDGNPILVDQHV